MNILMISMDETILTGAIGDGRARHEAYARRFGSISMAVCCTSHPLPLQTDLLTAVPTHSRSRLHYVPDGIRIGRQLAARRKPDVITTQDPFLTGLIGLRLRQVLRVPLIVQVHTTLLENSYWASESRQNRLLQRLARYVLPRADQIRVVNHAEREACIRLGIAPNRIQVIPVAIDVSRFAKTDTGIDWRAKLGIRPDQPVTLWVGRPVPFKNLPLLLEAFGIVHREMPEARLVLAGDMTETSYPTQISSNGLSETILLAGRVSTDDLPSLYQSADIYVHSSYYEGCPRVQIEAIAAGLPVVSTDMDGAREVVRDGETGLLTPMEPQSFADAILSLLRDPDRRRTMGAAAREDAMSRFDPNALVEAWINQWRTTARRGLENV